MEKLERVKFLIIGLDGATPELTWKWAAEGKLPNLARLIERGVSGPLRSTYPPISAAAWVTFMTGQNPGRHGIFDFRNFAPWEYSCVEEQVVSSRSFAGRTLWDLAGDHGLRVAAVTVPITYPAWEINGAMVSGYPTPDSRTAYTYPPELGRRMSHLTEDSAFFRSKSQVDVVAELNRLTRDRAAVAAEMLGEESYDLFVLVIGSTDRAHHDFWRHMERDYPTHDPQEAEQFGSAIEQVYREADAAVGALLEAVGEDTVVMVMSDHGGGARPTRRFNANAWLKEQGLLALKEGRGTRPNGLKQLYTWFREHFPYQEQLYRRLPDRLKRLASQVDAATELGLGQIDWTHTRAYHFPLHPPIDGIEINLAGRQPEGLVPPDAYKSVCGEILESLREARDPVSGEPLVVEVFRREELYAGEEIERAPDIIFELSEGYEGGAGLDGVVETIALDELRKLSGRHRMDGILIAGGPGIRAGERIEEARLIDLMPTILYGMGLPIPRDVDGEVLMTLFRPEFCADREIRRVDLDRSRGEGDEESPYSEEDERIIHEQLRRLGYIE